MYTMTTSSHLKCPSHHYGNSEQVDLSVRGRYRWLVCGRYVVVIKVVGREGDVVGKNVQVVSMCW